MQSLTLPPRPAWPTIRQLINALESGRYRKGRNFLYLAANKPEPMYCCLGVCAVEGKVNVNFEGLTSLSSIFWQLMWLSPDHNERTQVNTAALEAWLPDWMDVDLQSQLIVANDDHDTWDVVIEILKEREEELCN